MREGIEPPKYQCTCGWISWLEKYDLAYHAEQHNCRAAKLKLSKK